MPSLLRTEAVDRAQLITVRHTEVALDLSGRGEQFSSVSTITFEANQAGVSTFVDFKGVELVSATLNGRRIDGQDWTDGRIRLTDLAAINELVISGVMAYSSDGEGLHRHVDPADEETYLYAMSFLDAGPRWFACFDQPDLKSRYAFTVTAPGHWTVIGNGPSVEIEQPGAEAATRTWSIVPPQALSTYFITLVAGPYATVQREHDGILLGLHVRASLGDQLESEAEDLFEVTGQCFDHYHEVFGVRYPFGEYHQAFVPDFNAGAMENPGCVTFRDQFIFRGRATAADRATRAGVIAHEMAHQWFGDLVTMRWWDDLWLNESFAEYMAHRTTGEATRYPLWTEFGIVRKDWGMIADQAPSTHPIAGNGAADAQAALKNFDGISYAKGAAVLKQLATLLGDRVFFGGLRDYFGRYAFGNAEFAELLACWTGAGAQGLEAWSQGWLLTSGVDEIVVNRTDDQSVDLSRRSADPGTDRIHAFAVATLDREGTELSRRRIELGAVPVQLSVPLDQILAPDAGDESWAKIRLSEPDRRALGAILSSVEDPAIRVSAYNNLRDQVRDAELDPGIALDQLREQLPSEPDGVIVAYLMAFARESLAGGYSSVVRRPGRAGIVADLAEQILEEAKPGSDRQLVAFRAAVLSGQQVDRLQRWHAEQGLPTGLQLDPELRWSLVSRICTLSDQPGLIDRACASDPSASGRVHAARARAGLPTAAAKQAAWKLIMSPSGLSAYELYAAAGAFFHSHQSELTEEFVHRYFAEIGATAEFRSGWSLAEVASWAFPRFATEPRTLDLAEQTLSAQLAPGLSRSLVDGTDKLRRAVAAGLRYG